ncbi:nitroreductase [Natranaerovirga hydrolytica]|uniref:Nitroreductase n=1 Tax=Natranaerovirga hydrolytica TaxID=680378 RepID=A0A4R1MK12_9FIRM|nr:nitroreductase family protein [Natranaerovirga hydrolytica]TCK92350.1 nitroreductase [Natranaerovirga hydrolytica]
MIDLLKNRRSIRKYKNKPVEKEKIEKILKSALLSPSSRSKRPWEYIVVQDQHIIEQLSKSKEHGSAFIKDAPLLIVVIADESKCDVWVEDASIASIIIQLEAEKLDLGSCWIQIRKRLHNTEITSEAYVKGILEIPEPYKVLSIIAIGYKDDEKESYNLEELAYDKIHYNQFTTKG